MTGQSQAQGAPAHAIETSVQVALRIRPIVTDSKSQNKVRQRADTEVLSVVERSPTPSSLSGASGTGSAHDQPQQVAVVPLQRYFTFDHVFGTGASQEEVYQGSVKRMVDKFMEGYNVTIMAYGQTSSGKTYTMGTGAPTSEDRGGSSEGIIPRAMTQLFLDAKRPPPIYPGYKIPALKTTFRVSFVEIYNEDLIDLLVKGDFRPPVTIREDARGNIFWTGVQEIVVTSVEEVIHLLWFGSQNRQTHSTEMNEKSSRSHAIFSITLRQEKFVATHPAPPQSPASSAADTQNSPSSAKRPHSKTPSVATTNGVAPGSATSARPGTPTTMGSSSIPTPFTSGIVAPGSKLKRQSAMIDTVASLTSSSPLAAAALANDDPEPEGEWVVLNSKFHFVDLAGSERLKRTSAIGDRAKEGISINAGLHALGNVISALGDPSKKASHVPYRDSKLTRLLQDSLGGNALALMIACVSPSELNLGETLNTLKYANRARNIKNSSSLNQELNMDNPEYLRSIIQKLKLEIKILKEAGASRSAAIIGTGDSSGSAISDSASARASQSNRHSTASVSTIVHGGPDDGTIEDRAMSPSPSRKLSHFQSRDSISTDISHGYLDAVQEEDDRYSDASSSARTTAVGTGSSSASGVTIASPSSRANIAPLMIPPSLDSKSFQEFVEPVIEEYEKVISGLETHLAMTQAALNHSELMLEEQQGRIYVIEDENRSLMQKHPSSSGSESDEASSRRQQKELERQLRAVQDQLTEAEARKSRRDQYIKELEQKLAQEKAAALNQIQQAVKEKDEALLRSKSSSPLQASAVKEEELRLLSDKILRLEQQVRQHQEDAESEAEALRVAQSSTAALESDEQREEREVHEARREEELIEKLQTKAALELEIESEKARREALLVEVEASKASHARTDSAHADQDHGENVVKHLEVSHALLSDIAAESAMVKALETQLAEAHELERLLKDEIATLSKKLEKLQKDHASALEMEEMLHLAVSDLEGRLQTSQDSDSKHLEELEHNLARIQDLEERSTKAEQEALKIVEELKMKLAEAKAAAEERLADELLELLEKMEAERSKVEALQTQVENYLAELAIEKSRAADLETERDAIRAKWDVDKELIQTLEKEIEEQTSQVREKVELIASLEERVSQHDGTLAAKLQLEQELEQRVSEHDTAIASKVALILELEQKVLHLETTQKGSDESTTELVTKVQNELAEARDLLADSQTKAQEQERNLQELKDQVSALDAEASSFKDTLLNNEKVHREAIQVLESNVRIAEADRDDAETRLEEAERRHQAVDEEIKTLQVNVAQHLAAIDLLQNKLSDAQSPPSSRPVSMSSSATNFAPGEDPSPTIQKLEKEKARYRALVRENEKEIERLSQDLESLASEFSDAATAFEDAEEEMKARITELESILEGKSIDKPNNMSSTSLASSLASNYSARNRDAGGLHQSSTAGKTQLSALKAERDQALQSAEALSLIVAELNEKNHSLQERLLSLEREQESIKLQHVLERQAEQDELRMLRDRAERLDRNASPSPVGFHHHDDDRDRSASATHERVLRHKSSSSSDQFAGNNNNRGEDSLVTPRQSWSTTNSASQQPSSQIRAGRHESTLIQQAKHIKLLEERIADLQASGGSPSVGDGSNGHKITPLMSSASAVGLGIHHKSSDPELSRSASSPLSHRQSSERMSPASRSLSTFGGASAATPPTPPPNMPLPPPPANAAGATKITPAHLNGNAPPSPRIGGVFNLESSSPSSSPSMRPSRAGSTGNRASSGTIAMAAATQGAHRERDSTLSNMSEGVNNGAGNNNGWASPTGSNMSVSNISAATAQALQGVEVNELRGVVDTLAHQVQALKVEQTMQQGKVHRLEAALADAEERLRAANGQRETTVVEKEALVKELEQAHAELAAAKVKSEKDRAGLESIVEKERREREKAVETRAIMEARMEELMGRKTFHVEDVKK